MSVRHSVRPRSKKARPGDQPPLPAAGGTVVARVRLGSREHRQALIAAEAQEKLAAEAQEQRWAESASTASTEIKLRPDAPVEERARWLLGFAFLDLNASSAGDRLNLREALENFITPPGVSGTRILATGASLLSDGEIRTEQGWLRTGFAFLATRGRWSFQAPPTDVTLRLASDGLYDSALPVGTIPTAEAFRIRALQVLREAGPRFRLCRECNRPFIAGKGQEYCSTRCSQAVRTRTFRKKRQYNGAR